MKISTCVDKDTHALLSAEKRLGKHGEVEFDTIQSYLEEFEFTKPFDGIIISNVLPFLNKEHITRIITDSFDHLNKDGFLYFTLFGNRDGWSQEYADTMSFYIKEEALNILDRDPYFISEDYGTGSTMKGDLKTWHVLHLLYIK